MEGSSRASTIADLARRNGVEFPVEDPADLVEFAGLEQFLEIYDVVCKCLRTADDYCRITYECLEDAVAAGVRYREMFFSPGFCGVGVSTVWEGVSAGLADARADLDIGCRMILDFVKEHGPGRAREMAEFAGAQDRDLLIGMGADSGRRGLPTTRRRLCAAGSSPSSTSCAPSTACLPGPPEEPV